MALICIISIRYLFYDPKSEKKYYYPKHSEFYSIKKGNKEFIYTKEGKRLLNEDSISMVEVAIYHRGVIPTGEE